MRVHDRAVPTLPAGDRPGPDVPMGQWPAQLFVAIERTSVAGPRWDDFASEWDDPAIQWDDLAVSSSWTDAICDLAGLEIAVGTTNPDGLMDAGELNMTLANRDGQWSSYDEAGRRVDFPIGRDIAVWAVLDGEPWWLFYGEVVSWQESESGVVQVQAFDGLSRLNQSIGEWDPGAAGETPAERIDSILTLVAFPFPWRAETGDVTLLGPLSERTVLEELQQTALSDGGVIGIDADGTLVYRGRTWPSGRDDQTDVPVLSGNVCTADAIVWDPILGTDDDTLVNTVSLTNVALTPITVTAEDFHSQTLHGRKTLLGDRTQDLWQTAEQGQELADFLVQTRAETALRVQSCALYLCDPRQDLWRIGIDRRVGDVVELVQLVPAAGGGARVMDLFLAVRTITHSIIPGQWIVGLSTTRAISNRVAVRWDESTWTWDEIDPRNVWGH